MIGLSSIPQLKTATATINSSGENVAVAAVAQKYICVVRYKLRTASTVAVIVTAKDDAGGNVVDTDLLQAPTSGVFGSNESTPAPSYLFASQRGKPLIINLNGAVSVTYSITYYESEIKSDME